MSRKALAGLLLLLLALGAAAVFTFRAQAPERLGPTPLTGKTVDQVTRVDLRRGELTVTVQLSGGRWMITAPVEDRADPLMMNNLLPALLGARFGSVLSQNAAMHESYGVTDSTATLVRVFLKGSDKAAVEWLVGKPGADLESSFVREPGSPEVRTVEGLSSYLVTQPLEAMRDPSVLPVDPAVIDAVSFTGPKLDVSIAQSSGSWVNEKTKQMVGGTVLPGLQLGLRGWRATSFIPQGDLMPFGLATPAYVLKASFGQETFTVAIGGTVQREGQAERYVTVSDRKGVMTVPASSVDEVVSFFKKLS